jgi:hypothetical protein
MPSDEKTHKDAPRRTSEANGHREQDHVEPDGRSWVSLPPLPHLRMPGGVPGNVIWWGGLAALAVFGVLDWPVAAMIAAGTWVAEQQAKQARQAQATRA